jgi:hypothetical protein
MAVVLPLLVFVGCSGVLGVVAALVRDFLLSLSSADGAQ